MGFWSDLGSASAANIPKVIGGVIGAGINHWLQNKAREDNYKYNEMAADNADKRQRQQFYDLYSYSAQMKELQKAGLNPALMYSGGAGGQGGATAPQGGGAGGVQPGYSPLNLMSAAELKVMESQAKLNESEAEGKRIENQNKQDIIDADVALKLSQAGFNKASEAYKNVQKQREDLLLFIDEATTTEQMNEIISRSNKMYWESWLVAYESRSAAAQAEVDEATIQTRIESETAKYEELLTQIKVGNSVVRLNSATIQNMAKQIGIEAFKAETQRMSYEAQKKWFEDQITNQVNKLAQDKELTEKQIKAMKQGQWLNFASNIFGSICNAASSMGAAAK